MTNLVPKKEMSLSVNEHVKMENFNINTKFYDCLNDITDCKKVISVERKEAAANDG